MAIYARTAQTTKGGSRQLRRAALRALALAGVVGLSLLASACGDSSGAKVAAARSAAGGGTADDAEVRPVHALPRGAQAPRPESGRGTQARH
jgi:hypothetical protein